MTEFHFLVLLNSKKIFHNFHLKHNFIFFGVLKFGTNNKFAYFLKIFFRYLYIFNILFFNI